MNAVFGSPNMNLYFGNFSNISIYTSDDHAPIKNLSKEGKPFLDNLWIGNYFRHFKGVRNTYFIKYCVAKRPTERFRIPFENTIIRNEIKMEAE